MVRTRRPDPDPRRDQRFQSILLPFSETLQDVPLFSALYGELLGGHKLPTYLALITVPLAALLLSRTRFGLRLRAVGNRRKRWTAPASPSPGCVTAP